jgi:hypothetical protein
MPTTITLYEVLRRLFCRGGWAIELQEELRSAAVSDGCLIQERTMDRLR